MLLVVVLYMVKVFYLMVEVSSGADGSVHVGGQVKFLVMVQVMVRMVVQV